MAELGNHADLEISTLVGADGIAVVSVAGELDSASAQTLTDATSAVLANRPKRIAFDLHALRFMDSAGIAVLINTAREVGHVELRNPTAIVRRVIEATGLTSIFEVTP
jgi:anti-sigma B factor antagonist